MLEEEYWTEADINNMSMAEYAKHREYLMRQVGLMTSDEAREAMSIPKPPKPFHFEGF